MGPVINAYKILIGRPKGTRPLGKPRCTREDNIRMDIKEMWWQGMDWIRLVQSMEHWRALVNTVMKLRVP
jgi:hypothetical protein